MIPLNNNEIEAMRIATDSLEEPARHMTKRLLATIDLLSEKIRLKDDALLEGMAASYLSDDMEDEKELVREQLQDAMENDVMQYTQRAETLCLFYKLLEDLRLNPYNKTSLQDFLIKTEELQKEEDPLEELRENFKSTIGAIRYHEGFTVGINMEKKRILGMIDEILQKNKNQWPSNTGFLVFVHTIKENIEKG